MSTLLCIIFTHFLCYLIFGAIRSRTSSRTSPLISALRNPGMRERHWKELSSQIGIDIVLNDSFTLTKVFSLGLGSHIEVRVA